MAITKEQSDRIRQAIAFFGDTLDISVSATEMNALLDALDEAEAERDRHKARAGALERIVHGDCTYCTRAGCKTPGGQYAPCACINGNAWQFDEAWYAKGSELGGTQGI